ncbi:EPS biosynthesis protein [Herbaspirillum rubrisubalbicans]|uniref:EPS biosynthesis protein n=4 Tax=Herbaspirillum TaxID=963 RepID=A0ABX9C6R2_9BURK|nr:XrtB/PEP-CTERM-associated polysaccharide biosynthesis outer membrane protein EpsL [Herbaspirillum rubrisubalbicans]QJQ00681.1 EPS biosynthesis protein [Herbaspirillum rubrisubalbicans Os34]RAM66081.1 EPS biosynthesis protein [Herbaspirillum rubrisubalbicans]RAN50468.1 EPS biosynthesis protein [Herbaspirillum rubrisubalbicans]
MCALLVSMTCPFAYAADPGQVVVPYVQYTYLHDDNLLRLSGPDAAQTAFGSPRLSDNVQSKQGGLRIDKTLSRQHILLDASATKNTFDHFSQFDNDGRDLKADWGWVLGEHVSGNLGYVYSRSLTPFQNFRVLQANIRTMDTKYLNVAWQLHPDWAVHVQASKFGLAYDLLSQQSNNFTQNIAEFGVDYTPRSGSTAGLQVRRTTGRYPFDSVIGTGTVNNSFVQEDYKAKIVWLYSDKTKLQFLGGVTQRERDAAAPGSGYRGLNARLIGDWAATAKTGFTANLWREIGGVNDIDANFALTTGASLVASYLPTAKLRFDGLVDYEHRNYNGASIVTGVTPSTRRDNYEKATLSLTYSPTTSLSLMLAVYRENLKSNINSFSYLSNGISLTSRYEF